MTLEQKESGEKYIKNSTVKIVIHKQEKKKKKKNQIIK